MTRCTVWTAILVSALGAACSPATADGVASPGTTYQDLLSLFEEWREFERPALVDGAPDYTAGNQERRHGKLEGFQERLGAIDTTGWSVADQVDFRLVRAEMNGMDFHHRVLRPWARDPAFYASVRTSQSDTPAEEGPTIHHAVRLWRYPIWPRTRRSEVRALTTEEEGALAAEIETIPPLLAQARGNLAESDAGDLWRGGIRAFENQSAALSRLAGVVEGAGTRLRTAIDAAIQATDDFTDWLRSEAEGRTGPSGVGKEHYTWHLQNVLLVPHTWDDEVAILRQELARSHASLRLEEHRNRELPPLHIAQDSDEYMRMHRESLRSYMEFLERHQILEVEDWMEQALDERTRDFLPPERRTFFHQVRVREPRGLWTHWYHWWDLDRMVLAPHSSPIRREALRYNVWMSRAEGLATAMEEWMMQAGLYDDSPRSREIVWVMLAARAARGLASLYAHANYLTMEEAGDLHVEWTPRGWMRRDLDLLGFEQHLYLRQPGYGSSYVTGARMMDDLLATWARQRGPDFAMKEFFRAVDDAGMIPVSLLKWELTGADDSIRSMLAPAVR
jgi:hypothetical protein